MGDPAGIGPELLVQAVQPGAVDVPARLLLIACPQTLRRAAELRRLPLPLVEIPWEQTAPAAFQQSVTEVLRRGAIPCCNPTRADCSSVASGIVSGAAGDAAFRCLELAADLALSGHISALVTAPLNKEALHLAGYHYPGHTEILAERCGVAEFAMMLHLPDAALAAVRSLLLRSPAAVPPAGAHGISIAHVTLHTSVASIPGLLTTDAVAAGIRLMDRFLRDSGCHRRSIAVCALNPHGGEHGLFGDEESRIIEPAVSALVKHFNVRGPFPADTAVRRAVLGEFDGLIAMYHDQGHIPVKLIGFDAAINITLGLPIIRTSPTHGTAFDIAWKPNSPVNPSGLLGAIQMAARLAMNTPEKN